MIAADKLRPSTYRISMSGWRWLTQNSILVMGSAGMSPHSTVTLLARLRG
jgi:hypothetical protein